MSCVRLRCDLTVQYTRALRTRLVLERFLACLWRGLKLKGGVSSMLVRCEIVIVGLLAGLLSAVASPVRADGGIEIGKPHPPVVLPAADGDSVVSIDAFRGKKLLLIYFSPLAPESFKALTDWCEAVDAYRKSDKLVVLGMMEEQHRDRAELFLQWKRPPVRVLFDPLNLGFASRLPMVVAIDEIGTIRAVNPRLSKFESFEKKFLRRKPRKGGASVRTPQLEPADPRVLKRRAAESRIPAIERDYADANFLAGAAPQLDEAMRSYSRVLQQDASDAYAYFRLGVAFRTRAESPAAAPDDAAKAIECWKNALKLDPKNVVFKSRLAQFDGDADEKSGAVHWIEKARAEIRKRGETPSAIHADPSGDRAAAHEKKPAGSDH